jgi:ATP-dependent helicase YprA (DUF1998 family)
MYVNICLLQCNHFPLSKWLYRSPNATARLYNHLKLELEHGGAVDGLLDMYHTSVDSDSKDRILSSFKKRNSSIRFVISTIAFGMGIQVPDVLFIIHWGVPKSALFYWQEVGRAWCWCICYYVCIWEKPSSQPDKSEIY